MKGAMPEFASLSGTRIQDLEKFVPKPVGAPCVTGSLSSGLMARDISSFNFVEGGPHLAPQLPDW
jgi:hypothetical protein